MRVLAGPDHRSLRTGTPAVDLLLVALVVTAVVQSGRWIVRRFDPAPQQVAEARHAPEPPQQVVLTLRADGSYLVNGMGVDPRGLGSRLATLYRDRPVKLLFVEAAPPLPMGRVRQAVEIAYRAGVRTVGWLPAVRDAAAGRAGHP